MASSTSLTFNVFGRDVSASKTLQGVGEHAGKVGSAFGKMATIAGGALAAIGIANVAGQVSKFAQDSVEAFSTVGGETMRLQRYLGGTAEDASRMGHALRMSGLDTDTAAKSLGILSRHLVGGGKGVASLGIAVRDASGKLKPMNDLLPAIAERFKSMPDGPQKTALALQLFGRGGAAMLPFLNRGKEGLAALAAESDKLGTTLSGKDLTAVKENTKAKRTFGEAVKGLQISLGRELYPVLTAVTQFMSNNVVPVIRSVVGWMKEHSDVVGKVAAVIGVLVGAFGAAAAIIKVVTAVQAALNLVMAANPIGIVVIAIAALVAALIYAWNNFEGFRNVVTAVWNAVKAGIDVVVRWFQQTAWPILQTVIAAIGAYYSWLWNSVIQPVWNFIRAAIERVVTWFRDTAWPIIKTVVDLVAGYYRFLWNNVVQPVWSGIQAAISAVVGWFQDTAGPVIGAVVEGIKTVWNGLKSAASTAWNAVVTVVRPIVSTITGIIGGIKDTVEGIWNGAVGAAKAAFNGVARAWNSTVGSLSWDVPSWIPVIGGNSIRAPQIPTLAVGGIATAATLAVVGERGPEAIVPLSRAGDFGFGGGPQVVIQVSGVLVGTEDDLARAVGGAIDRAVARGTFRPSRIKVA